MKIKHLYCSIALLTVLFAACGKDKGIQSTTTVTTSDATAITANSAMGNGVISNDASNAVERGFCYGLNSNPIVGTGNFNVMADGAGNGSYSATLSGLTAGTLYHYRAFSRVPPGATYTYGEDKTFTTNDKAAMVTSPVTNITATTAHLKGSYSITTGFIATYKGFAYGTTPNPTVTNGMVQDYAQVNGTGTYELDATGLNPNTTYYTRAFAMIDDGTIVYDPNEQSFKTVGYPGSSGGYVVLDKGDTTGGWRFLEAAPLTIDYTNAGSGYRWGCSGDLINFTGSALGTGPANTNRILLGCSDPNCAARGCDNYTFNGLSDWFLPSSEEMKYTYMSLKALNVITSGAYWTSTEQGPANAASIYLNSNVVTATTSPKTTGYTVQPVRRF